MSQPRTEPARPGLTDDAARALVLDVLAGIAPGPDLETLDPHDDLRDTLGMDSLDFLALVTRVGERTGRRIEEDDYPELTDLDGWVRLLTAPGPAADAGTDTARS
jgi:acyl carrier protein